MCVFLFLGEKVSHLPTVFVILKKSYCITKHRLLGKHNLSDLHIFLKYSKIHCSILLISLKWPCTEKKN